MKLDFCVSHNHTQRDLLPPSHHHPPPPFIHCFFRIEKNHPEIKNIWLETMQVAWIKFTI